MCGRFTLKAPPRRINIINFDDFDLPALPPRYNIAPTQDVLTVVEREKIREPRMLQWGLIPFWSKQPKGIINARVETIAEKASFNESFQKRRCLVFADGFYEWERSGKISQPYYFQVERWRAIRLCRHLGSVANGRSCDHFMRNHHHKGE